MENISGTNITEHKSRVTVQHLFIAAMAVTARGGNLTNKNYKIGHAGLVTAQEPLCEKEFIGLLCIITHVGEMQCIMWARLQSPCHPHFNSHQSEQFQVTSARWLMRVVLAWLVAPFWVHLANLTPTVQTKKKRKSSSYTMDHLLVSVIWERAADVKTLWDIRAVCQTCFVGINKDSWMLETKTLKSRVNLIPQLLSQRKC